LRAGASAAAAGAGADGALAAATKVLSDGTGVDLDYLVLTDPDLGPAPVRGAARLLVAARVGSTRLIDNVPVDLVPGPAPERGN
jgi:pantoate--beta-alanine ligase